MKYTVSYSDLVEEKSGFFDKYEKGSFTRTYSSEGRIRCEQNYNPRTRAITTSWYNMDGIIVNYFNKHQIQGVYQILDYITKHARELFPPGWFPAEEPPKGD